MGWCSGGSKGSQGSEVVEVVGVVFIGTGRWYSNELIRNFESKLSNYNINK